MGRPPLPVGTARQDRFVALPNGQIQARARFRDYDGRIRLVAKIGRSRAAAERALKSELTNRQTPVGGGAIAASTRVSELARLWLDAPHGWSTGTERTYRSVIGKQVSPALGELRMQEVTPGVVSRAIAAIASGTARARRSRPRRACPGCSGLAIQDGAISANPVRDSSTQDQLAQEVTAGADRRRGDARWCGGCGRTSERSRSTCPTSSTGCWQLAPESARRWLFVTARTATASVA